LPPLGNKEGIVKNGLDGDLLSLFSKETDDDGNSFTSKTIKEPR
jgi:hypothetical protein